MAQPSRTPPRNFQPVTNINHNDIADFVASFDECVTATRRLRDAYQATSSITAIRNGLEKHRETMGENRETMDRVRELAVSKLPHTSEKLKSIVETCARRRLEQELELANLTTKSVKEFTGLRILVDDLEKAVRRLEHDANVDYYPPGLMTSAHLVQASNMIGSAENTIIEYRTLITDQIQRLTRYRKECREMAEVRHRRECEQIALIMGEACF